MQGVEHAHLEAVAVASVGVGRHSSLQWGAIALAAVLHGTLRVSPVAPSPSTPPLATSGVEVWRGTAGVPLRNEPVQYAAYEVGGETGVR